MYLGSTTPAGTTESVTTASNAAVSITSTASSAMDTITVDPGRYTHSVSAMFLKDDMLEVDDKLLPGCVLNVGELIISHLADSLFLLSKGLVSRNVTDDEAILRGDIGRESERVNDFSSLHNQRKEILHGADFLHTDPLTMCHWPPLPPRISIGTINIQDDRVFRLEQAIQAVERSWFDLMLLTDKNPDRDILPQPDGLQRGLLRGGPIQS